MTYFFKKPFAENGDITNIPTNPQGDGGVSYQEGWPEGYELDMQTNPDEAKNLSRTNFNGLFFNITDALKTLQIYGCNPYITAGDNDGVAYAYPEGGMCYYTDPVTGEIGVYRSLQSNNTDVPSTNGVTSNLWRREFDFQLDTLKSNRVTNCPLSYSQVPSYITDNESNTITVSVFAGTKVLMPNGFSDDQSYNNDIVQLVNTETVSYVFLDTEVNKYFFLTSNNNIILLDTQNYNHNTSLDMVNDELDGVTNYDVYYFNIDLNKWQYRAAGSDTFIDSPFSMVNIGSFTGSSVNNIGFSYNNPLALTSKESFDNKMNSVQTVLEPARYITLSTTPQGRQIMDINLPTTATPFCVNWGNINESGNADLLSSQSIVIPNKQEDKVTPQSGTIISNMPGNNYYVGGGYSGATAANIENIFGDTGGNCTVWFAYNYSSTLKYTLAEMTFDNPIELSPLGCYLTAQAYEYGYYYHRPGYELYYAYTWFYIDLFFDDGTSLTINTNDYGGDNYWKTISYNLISYANSGKKVTKLKVSWSGYMYNHCYGYWNWWYSVYSYIKSIRIINSLNVIQYQSNQVDFKIGSNYYKQLSANGDAMLSSDAGTITAKPTLFQNMWFDNNMVEIPSYVDTFSSTFEFNETPAETSNARLVLRYSDEENNQILGGIKIDLEYWGGATYNVVSGLVLDRSQDLIFSIPNGKYLKKITISASQMNYLSRAKIGKIQIYNNLSSEVLSSLVQYPAIQGTAADTDRTNFTLFDVDSLVVNNSGYLMMSKSGIYLLPGTNVIRKQKKQPTINDDPALTDGDVWLDYSKEPLIAYQYHNGKWDVFSDIPLGYVTLLWSDPTATASILGTGITAASVVAATFAQQVEASGTYEFIYDGTGWFLDAEQVTLTTYGVSYSGTPENNDKITVNFTVSQSSVQTLTTYPYNQNGYNINAFTENIGSLTGRDGRDGQDGKDGKNGAPGARGPAGVGIPTGGLTGQILAKASNADYSTKWTNLASNALFDGGTAGQTLIKNSSNDLDFSWGNVQVLPMGGATDQALLKNSSTDFDASWKTLHQIPPAGNTGQVLTKLSSSDYDAVWMNPGGGISQASLRKMDFKTSMYFEASIDGYTDLLLEQFIGLDGIAVADRPTVLDYYSAIEANIENSSENTLAFNLVEMSFSQAINYMEIEGDYTGTVTFKYSVDSGTTFVNFPENQMLQVSTNTLVLKIEMAAGAVLDNVAIFVK